MRKTNLLNLVVVGFLALISIACGTATSTKSGQSEKMNYTYLALGDSYTIGESVNESERYPNQLTALLAKKGLSVEPAKIIARTGWTTDELAEGIAAAQISGKKYDLVTLLIGVNNEFRHRSSAEYKTEFTDLLKQSIEFASGNKNHVFVISIPDYGFTPFGAGSKSAISPRIDEFNAINKDVAASMGVHYVDITPISRKAISDPELVAGDGLHPSGKQYGLWMDLMVNEVEKSLRK